MSIKKKLEKILEDLQMDYGNDVHRYHEKKLDFVHLTGNRTKNRNKAIREIKSLFKR